MIDFIFICPYITISGQLFRPFFFVWKGMFCSAQLVIYFEGIVHPKIKMIP